MPLFDSHAHLDDPQLAPELENWLQIARDNGLIGVTAIATTAATSQSCFDLALANDMIYASVGIHPNHCHEASPEDWELVCKLALEAKTVAIGETGLDRHWDYCPIETQRIWFERHIQLSFETNKPLVVHMRDCESDILDALRPHAEKQPINGIMHSFSGEWETAAQCLEWGMHISFAGMVTFKKSDELREIAARVPDDRLLIETDSPYLTPHPHRGKRPNHPAMVRHTAECLADVRGVSSAEVGKLTTENALRLFQIRNDNP